jgi:hypothetical protein
MSFTILLMQDIFHLLTSSGTNNPTRHTRNGTVSALFRWGRNVSRISRQRVKELQTILTHSLFFFLSPCLKYIENNLRRNLIFGRIAVRFVDNLDAISTKHPQTSGKGRIGIEPATRFETGNRHDRQTQSCIFGEKPNSQGITNAQCPLVQGVKGGGEDRNGIGAWEEIGFFWALLLASDRASCHLFKGTGIHKVSGLGRQNSADIPSCLLSGANQRNNERSR